MLRRDVLRVLIAAPLAALAAKMWPKEYGRSLPECVIRHEDLCWEMLHFDPPDDEDYIFNEPAIQGLRFWMSKPSEQGTKT